MDKAKTKENAKPFSKTIHMGGVKVILPVQPYQSQIQIMSKVIRGLDKQEHCLLESPTGSGKSLALLCSTLAWQQAKQAEALKASHEISLKLNQMPTEEELKCTCDKTKKDVKINTLFESCDNSTDDPTKKKPSLIDLTSTDSEEDNFQKPTSSKKKKMKEKKKVTPLAQELDKVTEDQELCSGCIARKNMEADGGCCEKKVATEVIKVPKIWYGTRTHKQITQIVHELGRTAYKNTNMTILSSREHSCIHPINKKSHNKNEDCKEWRDGTHSEMPGVRCVYHMNASRLRSHEHLYSCGLTSAWDIEDLVSLGEKVKSCPYYAAKELIASADIIFCPYNYLVDPNLREILKVNINSQVVIMDEAHNIEDSAREAASFSLTETDLANTTTDIGTLIAQEVKLDDHKPLHLLCMRVGQWLTGHCNNLVTNEYESSSTVWTGHDFLAHMAEWGITQDTLPLILKNFENAKALEEVDEFSEGGKKPPSMKSPTIHVLGGLFNVLSYLMRYDNVYCEDYRITIIKQSQYGVAPPRRTAEGWVSLSKRPKKYFVTTLNFWCLNPAVAFGDLQKAHSIILTSGTLSPMSSFASELGTQFPIKLEANHVIKDSQVWVGCLGEGPHGIKLHATYRNTESFSFQDELGECILRVCQTVPNGVLCFFSSYSLLNKLQERWQSTGLWYRLNEHKYVVSEPRKRSKADFENIMNEFYENVKGAEGQITGALMLAVCRGKISEGLDFADSNARAVITVGIPFPNFMDKQVKLKRSYNDKHKIARGLLSGSEWYDIQAFRAMNQALGRCIRHKNDWGALLIIDERFVKNSNKYCKGLSKWVRNKAHSHYDFSSAISSLKAFIEVQMFEMKNKDELDDTIAMDATTESSSSSSKKRRKESDDEVMHQSKTMVMDVTTTEQNESLLQNTILTQEQSMEETKIFPDMTVGQSTPLKIININNNHIENKNIHKEKDENIISLKKSDQDGNTVKKSASLSEYFKNTKKLRSNLKRECTDTTPHKTCDEKPIPCCKSQSSSALCGDGDTKAAGLVKVENVVKQNQGLEPLMKTEGTVEQLKAEVLSPCKENEPLEIPESPCDEQSMKFEHAEDETKAKKILFQDEQDKSKKEPKEVKREQSPVFVKTTRKKKRKGKKSKHVKEETSPDVIYCRHCKLIFNEAASPKASVRVKFRSVYLQEQLDTSNSMFELEYVTHSDIHEQYVMTSTKNDVSLNAVWSDEDKHCYKMYKCQKCNKFAAIRIVSNHNLCGKLLILD